MRMYGPSLCSLQASHPPNCLGMTAGTTLSLGEAKFHLSQLNLYLLKFKRCLVEPDLADLTGYVYEEIILYQSN